jgi:hypothetical protein
MSDTAYTEQDVFENASAVLHTALGAAVRHADHLARERGYGTETDADARVKLAELLLTVEAAQDKLAHVVEALIVRGAKLVGETRDLRVAKEVIKAREQERRRVERQKVDEARARDGQIR